MMVSIAMITYNHEKYIHEAIKGVLLQETEFNYELVIGEDCSTDSTRKICEEYALRFPNTIRLLPSIQNLGMIPNSVRTANACIGKYIAICEGDDFWTDPYKLQKQVDFMEAHHDVALCFTNSKILDDEKGTMKDWKIPLRSGYYEAHEIIYDLVIPTCSAVYRSEITSYLTSKALNKNYIMFDLITWLTCADFGKIYCINEQMVVYRRHSSSITSNMDIDKQIQLIYQHENILEDFGYKYKLLEQKFLSRSYLVTGLKCMVALDRRAFNLLFKAFTLNPSMIPSNLLYILKRFFVSDRSI